MTLGIKGYGGTAQNVEVTADQWTSAPVRFTTGATVGTATVYCYLEQPGTALCDDITLRVV